MFALPPNLTPPSDDEVSGIACPSCHGVLNVRAEGSGYLMFTCRVGHAFSLRDLVTALEQLFEDTVWASIRTAEEIDALLGDIMTYRRQVTDAPPEATYEARQRRSREQAAVLRELLEDNEPITFRAHEEANGGDVA